MKQPGQATEEMRLEAQRILVGYRAVDAEEVGRFPADFLQVSVYSYWPRSMERMAATTSACRSAAMPYVIHPVEYRLSGEDPEKRGRLMEEVRTMARAADMALIIHDESMPKGGRITGARERAYREAIEELSGICRVSIENASDCHDIRWFWRTYAQSITLDIGHLEASGIDALAFIDDAREELAEKLDFVHLHRVAGLRKGLHDHWGLVEGCKELRALEHLLSLRRRCGIILEIIEAEDVERSLELLRETVKRAW